MRRLTPFLAALLALPSCCALLVGGCHGTPPLLRTSTPTLSTSSLPVGDHSTIAQLRTFIKSQGLTVKTSGPGRNKAAILKELRAAWDERTPEQPELIATTTDEGLTDPSRLQAIRRAARDGECLSDLEEAAIHAVGGPHSSAYGEITPVGFRSLVQRLQLGEEDTFADLGSGARHDYSPITLAPALVFTISCAFESPCVWAQA